VVLETRLERTVDIVCLQEPLSDTAAIGINHSAYNITKRKRVLTPLRKGSGLEVEQGMDLSSGANDDVIAADFRRTGEKKMRNGNIYNLKGVQS
jgi:hypothetical protein